MAQTTQIVPKYSFPYVETHVNDYTQVVDIPIVEADTSIKLAFAVTAAKGIDNVWVRKKSKSSAVKTFGDSNFKKFGQPLMQALNVLEKDNSQVWMMRVMPENAAYSNSIVSAYYKADTADDVADAHKRKFRIKLTAKSFKDICTKEDLAKAAETLDGPSVLVGDQKVYTDGEGFNQVPFMTVKYSGRGKCGDAYSMRMNQAYTYEREYGIKMYNFEIITSENSISKEANYVGALVTSNKYGVSSTTLIDDVLSDAEVGDAPVDVHVNEDNVAFVYDAYVDFIKTLHVDLIDEYERKLDEYAIPEEMMNGTIAVTDEYADKLVELNKIDAMIDETDDSNIPDIDCFDLLFGLKVASSDMIPAIAFCKTLTDNVDTTADDYDELMYTTSEVVDFQSVKGLRLYEGGNGYFDNPRTNIVDGVEVQNTYDDELEICLKKAYDGTYDSRILSSRLVPVSAWFDANYPMEVKKQIVDLAAARFDCRVYLDAGIIPSLANVYTVIRDFSIFDDHMVSVDFHSYTTREYSTNKKFDVTISYLLAAQYIEHITRYGYHIPFCKEYVKLTGHIKDSLKPIVDEYNMDLKESLNKNRINFFECLGENQYQRATQNTTQKNLTDLLEESNSTILFNIKRLIELDVQKELYNFADETVRNSFIEVERAKYASLEGSVVESFGISFATSEYEFERSILHCYLAITFRGLTKQAIVEIDLNKRTYNPSNGDEE